MPALPPRRLLSISIQLVPPHLRVFLGVAHLKQSPLQPSLCVTGVLDAERVAISGRPDSLEAFASTLSPNAVVHKTTIEALYHSSEHIGGAREHVLADVIRRQIHFPSYSDLHVPIRSTYTGKLLRSEHSPPLVEAVIDMILAQPVHWDKLIRSFVQDLPVGCSLRLVNVGPGTGLARSTEKNLSAHIVSSVDLTSADPVTAPTHEPIAIIGMAVNLPGAPNADELWNVLERGLNTIAEVCCSFALKNKHKKFTRTDRFPRLVSRFRITSARRTRRAIEPWTRTPGTSFKT